MTGGDADDDSFQARGDSDDNGRGTGDKGRKRSAGAPFGRCSGGGSDVRPRPSFRRKPAPAREEPRRLPSEIKLRILSASYGPCELHHGGGLGSGEAPVPSTRDCSSLVLGLLWAASETERGDGKQEQPQPQPQRQNNRHEKCHDTVRLSPTVDGKIQGFLRLLPGVDRREDTDAPGSRAASMNAIFGDPCPGKTKRLEVKYTVTEVFRSGGSGSPVPPRTEIHRASFAEHETVRLRRCLSAVHAEAGAVAEGGESGEPGAERLLGNGLAESAEGSWDTGSAPGPGRSMSWQLRSETVLPIVIPFLDLWERMQCRLICRCWKKIVQECGVSRSIDANNNAYPVASGRATPSASTSGGSTLTPKMLRELLAYSYSSLQSLFLSGFGDLEKEDLHSALPHLQNLRVLDVSHCPRLDDSTLKLLARSDVPSSASLRVLYLKGLRRITDAGLEAICASCVRLEVLDLSHLTNITDKGGTCIRNLVFLRALFLRDNWKLTNNSIDAITTSCSKLEQLTLWGCVRLHRLAFQGGTVGGSGGGPSSAGSATHHRLVILNLWGCHDLEDDTATVLSTIHNLDSLIVSECHRLTDRFVRAFVEGRSQRGHGTGRLRHLHLRYLKRITDASVGAIALGLRDLYSVDLSFCSRVTATGVYRLLHERRDSLAELRLASCRGLQIGRLGPDRGRTPGRRSGHHDHAGHWILNALRRRPHSTVDHPLCLLDARGCGGQPAANLPYPEDDPFVGGMAALGFSQAFPGCFSRPVLRG
ncbi:unnamed protein product [Pseudo-nitzschia multistriata]|uniref:F-box/LRR-repeat protein 15-like leucin rich repeat domain-containing protein n=1 Tax=Pseudo-nitzschia multistriata TaxID=183589 RepID=A0A448ZCU9_9STRA|nr:unnamed protein product [Pseudo-nitzschia multistriata]